MALGLLYQVRGISIGIFISLKVLKLKLFLFTSNLKEQYLGKFKEE